MAAASLTVMINEGKTLRVYGGNRGDVKGAFRRYSEMTLEQFLTKHPKCTEEDYRELKLSTRFNKR